MKKLFVAMALAFSITLTSAMGFNDSKCLKIGVSGDVYKLEDGDFYGKFFRNNVQLPPLSTTMCAKGKFNKKAILEAFQREHIGKKILDILFQYDGHHLSEDLLKERAWKHVQLVDEERANIGIIDKETILREDYLPILQNNYIFLAEEENIGKNFWQVLGETAALMDGDTITASMYEDRYKINWIVFKVQIDEGTLNQVFNCWDNMKLYNQIDVPIVYVASGSIKKSNNKLHSVRNALLRSVSKKVEAFAIYGQVIDNHPLKINVGSEKNVIKGDQFYIYRQHLNKQGRVSSKKVGSARAGIVDMKDSRLFLSSGTVSYKTGDIAVLHEDNGVGHSLTYNWLNMEYDTKYQGLTYTFDKRLGFNRHGFSTYCLASVGLLSEMGMLPNQKLFDSDAPLFLDLGLGLGLGKVFLSRIEIVPYIQLHYMIGLDPDGEYDDYDFSQAFKLPIGVRFNVNLFHPLQLTMGAEYNILATKDGETWGESSGEIESGIGLFAGLRLVF